MKCRHMIIHIARLIVKPELPMAVNMSTMVPIIQKEPGGTGGGKSHENRPPFYNVYWIMKVK